MTTGSWLTGKNVPENKNSGIRPVAYATPLWHGVALCRSLSLGTATLGGALGHITYLVLLTAAGIAAGHRTYVRRLYV